jgi:hypothetical protein
MPDAAPPRSSEGLASYSPDGGGKAMASNGSTTCSARVPGTAAEGGRR